MTTPNTFDAVVIGGGPSGSIASYFLRKLGHTVLVLERLEFPRYRIGESLTGVTGDFIRELGLVSKMNEHKFPPKSGVKVIGREAKNEFFIPVPRPTWQVLRSKFDEMLMERTKEEGTEVRYGLVTDVHRSEAGKITGVRYTPHGDGDAVDVECKAVIDASGHSAVLSRLGIAGPRRVDAFGRQIAVFTQYKNTIRDPGAMGDNTFILYSKTYHWAWFIPLSPEVVSVGCVMPLSTYRERGTTPEEVFEWGINNVNPELRRRVKDAEQCEEVRVIRNYSYRIEPFAGDGWFCVGDSHRFTDPIFSFGVSMAMLESKAAAHAISKGLASGDFVSQVPDFTEYSNIGQNSIYDFIRYFWKYPAFFGIQSRGRMRRGIISLFAVESHKEVVQEMMVEMRRALYSMRAETLSDEHLRAVGERALARFTDFQGIEAIYIARGEDTIDVAFILDDVADEIGPPLKELEAELKGDIGEDKVRFLVTTSANGRGHLPEGAQALFDRKLAHPESPMLAVS